ncbi:MAG: hypothetical protein AB7S26_12165 [Sandaracinaceae bacterium]
MRTFRGVASRAAASARHQGRLAEALLEEIAQRRIANVEADFESAEVLADLGREGVAMGDFVLLPILESIQVDPAVFLRWRDAWRAAKREPHPSEVEFFERYDACLESAFEYGIARFATR